MTDGMFPAAHPDCRCPHFTSPVQVELLDRAVDVLQERDRLARECRVYRRLEEARAQQGGDPDELGVVAENEVLRERVVELEGIVRRLNDKLIAKRKGKAG